MGNAGSKVEGRREAKGGGKRGKKTEKPIDIRLIPPVFQLPEFESQMPIFSGKIWLLGPKNLGG